MAKILNCTPHDVTLYIACQYDSDAGSCKGGKKLITFPRSDFVASAKTSIDPEPDITLEGTDVPVVKREFTRVSQLPPGYDFYLVSSVYALAMSSLGLDTSKLLSPFGSVVDKHGKQIGCTGLVRAS